MTSSLDVQDLTVRIDGTGPTLVMLQGWPDTLALWDGTVAALSDRYRCVRFSLPGFDLSRPPRPVLVDQMCRLIGTVVDAVSPDEPVTLLLHGWGCFYGYEYAARHRQRVARVVGTDVGDTRSGAYLRSLTGKQKRMIASYRLWLVTAWRFGGVLPGLGGRKTRFMARCMGCSNAPEHMGWQTNHPFVMQWFGTFGGLRGVARLEKVFAAQIPTLFRFGRRKPFMFHSASCLADLGTTPGCRVQGFDAGHWLMLQQSDPFHATVRAWLDAPAGAA